MNDFPIDDGVELPPRAIGGRPALSERKSAIVDAAARQLCKPANAAAIECHAAYFGTGAKTDGQRESQIKYLARLIRNRRRGLLPLQ